MAGFSAAHASGRPAGIPGQTTYRMGASAGAAKTPAGPTTHIYATDWGLTLKANGTGFYNDLARLLLSAPDIGPVEYEILPYRRANRSFIEDKTACKYPSNLTFTIKGGTMASANGYVTGKPFVLTRLHLFSRPGDPPITDQAAINGKTIAYAMGARTPARLRGHDVQFIAVANEVDKARMLLSGRVDMITATLPDAEFVFRKLGVKMAPYAPTLVLDTSPMGVDCHNTPQNIRFLTHLNARVDHLLKNGALRAFFKKHGLDPDLYLPRNG
ncbi:substrate-binding periplasmic protein [Kordiimonas marina]|uniref:substrate-binding periplasmic protein n=1 Tax=Kordiimonas marina TaxID=2872312 RepID=UPI001FF3F9F9|nr:hypothetical protein [Kordiimonas marina]MCJ9428653.1 hypothetical protein [Kordiimonas marina]